MLARPSAIGQERSFTTVLDRAWSQVVRTAQRKKHSNYQITTNRKERFMIDGIFAGLLGGLFGPALATWMSRFRYWMIFVFVTFTTYVYLFLRVLIRKEPKVAAEALSLHGLTPEIVLTSMGIGLLAVLVAFVGSAANPIKTVGARARISKSRSNYPYQVSNTTARSASGRKQHVVTVCDFLSLTA